MNKQELIARIKRLDEPYLKMGLILDLIEQLDEPQPIKLKDVIARIKIFDVGTQKVWLNEILNELGSDYGASQYKAGYEQGKLEGEWVGQQLKDADKIRQELNKPMIPQFVADWIEYCKNTGLTLKQALMLGEVYFYSYANQEDFTKLKGFLKVENNQELFARAWLDGYTVEKEPKYTVKCKATKQYLSNDDLGLHFEQNFRSNFTKSDFEKLGLDWVLECEGMEVEKVGK